MFIDVIIKYNYCLYFLVGILLIENVNSPDMNMMFTTNVTYNVVLDLFLRNFIPP